MRSQTAASLLLFLVAADAIAAPLRARENLPPRMNRRGRVTYTAPRSQMQHRGQDHLQEMETAWNDAHEPAPQTPERAAARLRREAQAVNLLEEVRAAISKGELEVLAEEERDAQGGKVRPAEESHKWSFEYLYAVHTVRHTLARTDGVHLRMAQLEAVAVRSLPHLATRDTQQFFNGFTDYFKNAGLEAIFKLLLPCPSAIYTFYNDCVEFYTATKNEFKSDMYLKIPGYLADGLSAVAACTGLGWATAALNFFSLFFEASALLDAIDSWYDAISSGNSYEMGQTTAKLLDLATKTGSGGRRRSVSAAPALQSRTVGNDMMEEERRTALKTRQAPPAGWTCDPTFYNATDGCDCACGVWDPDCEGTYLRLLNCDPTPDAFCNRTTAQCQYGNEAPANWTCLGSYYGTQDGCDCACGVWDPDCDIGGQSTLNCVKGTGPTCTKDVANNVGVCEYAQPVPDEWFCDQSWYNASDACHCNCGAFDPDCDRPDNIVKRCPCYEMTCGNANGLCKGLCGGFVFMQVPEGEVETKESTPETSGASAGSSHAHFFLAAASLLVMVGCGRE